jgi:hypothetical protein|tara:strand:- start:81 stop:464 length:384 start_codon:yes stop_codon:yes gene_type:complete
MTILVPETDLTQEFTVNIANMAGVSPSTTQFVLTSQYSHQPLSLGVNKIVKSNARYTKLQVTFPTGFGNEHKNGIYNWRLVQDYVTLEAGLVKIVTNPGGGLGLKEFVSTPQTEERVSDVFFRPNYL